MDPNRACSGIAWGFVVTKIFAIACAASLRVELYHHHTKAGHVTVTRHTTRHHIHLSFIISELMLLGTVHGISQS